jgi:signal transduction histidine kinase
MLDRLQDSFEKQTRFTADASHELRTPLAVMLTHCELALSRPRTAEELKQTVGVCQRAAERMRRLVEGLLTLAKSDAGDEEDQRQRTDLRGVADEALTMLEPIARQSGIELRVEGEGAEAFVDPSKLSQAVLNLVHNAILYNRPGGGVVVKVWDEGQRACLSVTDTGIGIPAESLPRLFDRFYRVDPSRSQTPGSGLGLAISKSHIESQGGTLDVTSEVGRGSVFTIALPRLVTTI